MESVGYSITKVLPYKSNKRHVISFMRIIFHLSGAAIKTPLVDLGSVS